MKYARISNGTVVELVIVPKGLTIAEMFHEDIAATIVEAGDEVDLGWSYDGSDFSEPAGPSLDERKAVLSQQIDGKRDALIGAGYQHNFGGSVGIRKLDNRNEADAINWLGLKGICDTLIASGQGSMKVGIVAADNSVFEASAETVAGALVSMALWRSKLVLNARNLKNAVTAAKTEAALDKLDIEAGWSI